jgi:hypothetical protein
LSTTSAARLNKVVVTPLAISAMLRIEHGATTMPIVLNEPEEIGAARSPIAWTTSARLRTTAGFRSVSSANVTSAARLMTRCVSTGSGRNNSSSRAP